MQFIKIRFPGGGRGGKAHWCRPAPLSRTSAAGLCTGLASEDSSASFAKLLNEPSDALFSEYSCSAEEYLASSGDNRKGDSSSPPHSPPLCAIKRSDTRRCHRFPTSPPTVFAAGEQATPSGTRGVISFDDLPAAWGLQRDAAEPKVHVSLDNAAALTVVVADGHRRRPVTFSASALQRSANRPGAQTHSSAQWGPPPSALRPPPSVLGNRVVGLRNPLKP